MVFTATITANDGTFASSGSAVLTLYDVQSENISKTSGLIEFPMPTMDSDDKIVMDLMGAGREITIEGIVTTQDVSPISNYVKDIVGLQGVGGSNNTLISGAQGGTYGQFTYNSYGISDTISVVVSEANVSSEKGNPEMRKYSITLIEYGILV